MEHLMSAKERRERQVEIRNVPAILWLGFNHDESHYPLTTIQQYPIIRDWSTAELRGIGIRKSWV